MTTATKSGIWRETEIKNLRPQSDLYRQTDSDGLVIEVPPVGSKRWRMRYRIDGKEKLMSLGTYPAVSIAQARRELARSRQLVAQGLDPVAERKAAKKAQTAIVANKFEAVAREWFPKWAGNKAPSHTEKVQRALERDVFPWIGCSDVGELDAQTILGVLRRIEDRGSLETADRIKGNISQILRYAVATGRAARDVTFDLRGAIQPAKTRHHPTVTDPVKIGELLRVIHGYSGTAAVATAIKLAPLVFVRPGELRQAQWSEIDLENAIWSFKASKTETDHIVPLSRQAVALLKDIKPLTGRGRYVFPSARTRSGSNNERPMSENSVNAALRRSGVSKDEFTGHGFRAMARTVLDEALGYRPEIIEQQLAHAVRDTLGRAYNRTTFLDQRREMMQRWADWLDECKLGRD